MAIKTPTINKIIRMTEFDLLRTAIVPGNMYMCLDSQKLYYDETASKRVIYYYTSVKTLNDLLYNITPSSGTTYYCWEDNSLWLWMNRWIAIYSTTTYPSAYKYDSNRNIEEVYRYDQPNIPADDNGLLKDGSVVIRDRQRIIKGKIYINDDNDNMTISSFLGGGIRFLPNGKMDTDGELLIGDDGLSTLRSQFSILNNEMYVDYTEKPELDNNEFANNTHKYQVFHEGNLDVSAIKVLTPEDIYKKLQDPSLPSPLELNVSMLGGREATDYTLVGHTHLASNITDFNEKAKAQSEIKVKEIFNNMTGEGIDITYDSKISSFTMSANTFEIVFDGGITGTAKVNHLGNTTAEVIVNPAKHIHQNYVDIMNNLQDQIDGISSVDPTNYYNKEQTDNIIADITGTDIPTIGKPLLVNSNLILPGTSESTTKLKDSINIKIEGDIQGEVLTDLSSNVIIDVNADNILSDNAEIGKAVKVNAQGNLPVNSTSASKLNHNINLILDGEAQGEVEIDTSTNEAILNVSLIPGDNILQTKDLGINVASLDASGKIPSSQLPATQAGLVPMGWWNPETGAPSENPADGYFWICDTEGTFNEHRFEVDDWCLWYDSEWHHINTESNVLSINGQEGDVILKAEDVNALSREYINYNIGETIPANKIVMTSLDGKIEGATVPKLSDSFTINTDELGDVVASVDSIISTDGSNNIDLKLEFTQAAYDKIKENTGHKIFKDATQFAYHPNLVFSAGLDVTEDGDNIIITGANAQYSLDVVYWNGEQNDEFLSHLLSLYRQRASSPFAIEYMYDHQVFAYVIDGSYPAISADTVVTIPPDHPVIKLDKSNPSIVTEYALSYNLDLHFSYSEGEPNLDSLSISESKEDIATFLTTTGLEDTESFNPIYNSHPATKEYVDNKFNQSKKFTTAIGNGIDKEFTITHNLATFDINLVCRYAEAGDQVFVANRVTDENSVTLIFDTVPGDQEISVCISKM